MRRLKLLKPLRCISVLVCSYPPRPPYAVVTNAILHISREHGDSYDIVYTCLVPDQAVKAEGRVSELHLPVLPDIPQATLATDPSHGILFVLEPRHPHPRLAKFGITTHRGVLISA